MAGAEVPDVETSRRIGKAAIAVLIALAADSGFGVLESVWRRSVCLRDLARLPAPVIETFCRCDPQLARSRYAARSSTRAPGHFDRQRLEDAELWTGEAAQPVAGGWPVVEVETTHALDVAALVRRIGAAR